MVILVDTSIWVNHLRKKDLHLSALLEEAVVAIHPFTVGELALGRLKKRREILSLLHALPEAPLVSQAELLHFIEKQELSSTGIGFVDAHLLASSELIQGMLWTADRPLWRAADKLDLAYN